MVVVFKLLLLFDERETDDSMEVVIDEELEVPDFARVATPIPMAAIIMITITTITILEMASFCLLIAFSQAY